MIAEQKKEAVGCSCFLLAFQPLFSDIHSTIRFYLRSSDQNVIHFGSAALYASYSFGAHAPARRI